jgi:hypothetical protein
MMSTLLLYVFLVAPISRAATLTGGASGSLLRNEVLSSAKESFGPLPGAPTTTPPEADNTGNDNCGYLVAKVLTSIKFHLGRRHRAVFASDAEAELFTQMKDGDNGRDVMSNTMRVLGNYTLPEGIMAGSLWTIDDQNHYISCEQNIRTRLEEHTHTNGNTGDALMQGDMAVTTTLCHYSEQSSKYSERLRRWHSELHRNEALPVSKTRRGGAFLQC